MQKVADAVDISVLFFQLVLIFEKATCKTMQALVPAAPVLHSSSANNASAISIWSIWSAAMLPGDRYPIKCDKCQYSGDYLFKIKDHRKEKHRLWECLRCDGTFFNQPSFDKHDCDPHPFAFQKKLWKT